MKVLNSESERNRLDHQKLKAEKPEEIDENNEPSDVGDLPAKPNTVKPNNLPAALLILAFILANIEVSQGLSCSSSSDIRWISKRTNKVVGCTPCPSCPPSQEYSIPCGSKAYIGTTAKCVSCPQGKYSSAFDHKPCIACTICSDKIVKQNCTLSRNAICGVCKPGFYYQNVSFSCMKCGRCCHDGQDKTHSSCTAVNLCKSRPFGCPFTTSSTNIPATVEFVIPSSISKKSVLTSSSLHKHMLLTATPTPKTSKQKQFSIKKISNSSKTSNEDGHKEPQSIDSPDARQPDNGSIVMDNPWIIVVVVILCVVVILLITVIIIILVKRKKPIADNPSHNDKYLPVSQLQEAIHMTDMCNNDQTLEIFFQKNYVAVDKFCKVLCKKKQGMWDFERVANQWGLAKEDVLSLKNELHAEQGSPVRKLLEVLCSQRLCKTVRELANSLKSINIDAYEVLEPHFLQKPIENTSS